MEYGYDMDRTIWNIIVLINEDENSKGNTIVYYLYIR